MLGPALATAAVDETKHDYRSVRVSSQNGSGRGQFHAAVKDAWYLNKISSEVEYTALIHHAEKELFSQGPKTNNDTRNHHSPRVPRARTIADVNR